MVVVDACSRQLLNSPTRFPGRASSKIRRACASGRPARAGSICMRLARSARGAAASGRAGIASGPAAVHLVELSAAGPASGAHGADPGGSRLPPSCAQHRGRNHAESVGLLPRSSIGRCTRPITGRSCGSGACPTRLRQSRMFTRSRQHRVWGPVRKRWGSLRRAPQLAALLAAPRVTDKGRSVVVRGRHRIMSPNLPARGTGKSPGSIPAGPHHLGGDGNSSRL